MHSSVISYKSAEALWIAVQESNNAWTHTHTHTHTPGNAIYTRASQMYVRILLEYFLNRVQYSVCYSLVIAVWLYFILSCKHVNFVIVSVLQKRIVDSFLYVCVRACVCACVCFSSTLHLLWECIRFYFQHTSSIHIAMGNSYMDKTSVP
jgi:hypothetical protein